jgi:hypothetical protein
MPGIFLQPVECLLHIFGETFFQTGLLLKIPVFGIPYILLYLVIIRKAPVHWLFVLPVKFLNQTVYGQ